MKIKKYIDPKILKKYEMLCAGESFIQYSQLRKFSEQIPPTENKPLKTIEMTKENNNDNFIDSYISGHSY